MLLVEVKLTRGREPDWSECPDLVAVGVGTVMNYSTEE